MRPPAKAAVAVESSYPSVPSLEQAKCAEALVKMRLANRRGNLEGWQTKAIGTPSTFGFDNPKSELRQSVLHIGKTKGKEVEIHRALRFGCKLFCH